MLLVFNSACIVDWRRNLPAGLEKLRDLRYDGQVRKARLFEVGKHPPGKSGQVVVGGENMYIIVGLGNPGKQYAKTRHNVGFDTIDRLADRYNISVDTKKHKALCGKGMIEGQKVVLAKPQTFMNLSGESVRELTDFYKIDPEEELIVIYDDISLEPGQLRVRPKGSAGGHNGIKNIIAQIGTQVFKRVKVGVGEKPKGYDLADYVLGHFSKEERAVMEDAFERAAEAAVCMMNDSMEHAMNQFNKKVEK